MLILDVDAQVGNALIVIVIVFMFVDICPVPLGLLYQYMWLRQLFGNRDRSLGIRLDLAHQKGLRGFVEVEGTAFIADEDIYLILLHLERRQLFGLHRLVEL